MQTLCFGDGMWRSPLNLWHARLPELYGVSSMAKFHALSIGFVADDSDLFFAVERDRFAVFYWALWNPFWVT
jgi:hypothetical protein